MIDILCILLILACVAGIIYMIFNIRNYWKKNKETPLQEKAQGMQIRMTILPIFFVLICVFVLIMKKF